MLMKLPHSGSYHGFSSAQWVVSLALYAYTTWSVNGNTGVNTQVGVCTLEGFIVFLLHQGLEG